VIEIELSHTHLFKGARGRIVKQRKARDCDKTLVQFADGVIANGRLVGSTLIVQSYVTRAGTAIASKAWRLRFPEDGSQFLVDRREAIAPQHEEK